MVEVSRLTKQYGRFTALQNISFDVRAGEAFAVLGPNGSGKTTLLKCITGLNVPDTGTVLIGGVEMLPEAIGGKALFSYLPQRVFFNENLTARELLAFYARLRRLPPDRTDHVLHDCGIGLNGFENKPINQYSGGMIQRLGIALALLPDAPLLILDEPGVSLDPEGAIRFRELFGVLKRNGKTILFSSHGLSDVEMLADRVAVLVGGRLVALESVVRLQDELTQGGRLRIVLANPEPKYAAVALIAGASTADYSDGALTVSCSPQARLPLLHAIEQAGGRIGSFSTDDATLEEMYLRYVSQNGNSDPVDPPGGMRPGSSPPR